MSQLAATPSIMVLTSEFTISRTEGVIGMRCIQESLYDVVRFGMLSFGQAESVMLPVMNGVEDRHELVAEDHGVVQAWFVDLAWIVSHYAVLAHAITSTLGVSALLEDPVVVRNRGVLAADHKSQIAKGLMVLPVNTFLWWCQLVELCH